MVAYRHAKVKPLKNLIKNATMAGMDMFSHVSNRDIRIIDLGFADYRHVLEQQQNLQAQRKADQIPDTVLLVEHPEVITLGAREAANQLLVTEEDLRKKNIDLVVVRRGGGGTAHNPGQLVCYPILNLQNRGWTISDYIGALEALGCSLLTTLEIHARQMAGKRGLWVDDRKIASIGVRISRSVTYHGIAINIQNDLRIFDYLVPCGLDGVVMTSAQQETGKQYDLDKVKQQFIQIVKDHFRLTSDGPNRRTTPDSPSLRSPWRTSNTNDE